MNRLAEKRNSTDTKKRDLMWIHMKYIKLRTHMKMKRKKKVAGTEKTTEVVEVVEDLIEAIEAKDKREVKDM